MTAVPDIHPDQVPLFCGQYDGRTIINTIFGANPWG
jgi:hypothetical protein